MRSNLKTISLLGCAALCLAMTFQLRMVAAKKYSLLQPDEDRYVLPPGKWLYALTLGFNEVTASLIWARTLVYVGSQTTSNVKEAANNFTMNYLGIASEMDPKFRKLYTVGTSMTLFQNLKITRESVDMTIELLKIGMKELPNDGEIAFNLGFMHFYEMRPFIDLFSDDPEARAYREAGLIYLSRAALMPRAPKYAAGLATSLFGKNKGFNDLAIEHVKSMLAKEVDPSIRTMLEERLRELLGKAAEQDIEATGLLVDLWRKKLPFVPFDHYLLLDSDFSYRELIDPLAFSNRILEIEEEETDTRNEAVDRRED